VSECPDGQMPGRLAIAVEGSRVHVVWSTSPRSIVCRTSADSGATWGDSIVLSESPGNNVTPRIATSGLRVYVAWLDSMGISGGNEEALLAVSSDGGASFATPVNLSNSAARSKAVAIAAAGDNVYAVWHEDVGGDEDVLFRASSNGGASFRGTVNLSKNTLDCQSPCIAAYGDNVHVAWTERPSVRIVLFRCSTNGGADFSSTIELTPPPRGHANTPSIVARGSSAYVVWNDRGPVFRKGTRPTTRPPSMMMRRAPVPRPETP
jgi:hypothetical protein